MANTWLTRLEAMLGLQSLLPKKKFTEERRRIIVRLLFLQTLANSFLESAESAVFLNN